MFISLLHNIKFLTKFEVKQKSKNYKIFHRHMFFNAHETLTIVNFMFYAEAYIVVFV